VYPNTVKASFLCLFESLIYQSNILFVFPRVQHTSHCRSSRRRRQRSTTWPTSSAQAARFGTTLRVCGVVSQVGAKTQTGGAGGKPQRHRGDAAAEIETTVSAVPVHHSSLYYPRAAMLSKRQKPNSRRQPGGGGAYCSASRGRHPNYRTHALP
jgi:hypothetical protein